MWAQARAGNVGPPDRRLRRVREMGVCGGSFERHVRRRGERRISELNCSVLYWGLSPSVVYFILLGSVVSAVVLLCATVETRVCAVLPFWCGCIGCKSEPEDVLAQESEL